MFEVGARSIYYANINSHLDKAHCITHTLRGWKFQSFVLTREWNIYVSFSTKSKILQWGMIICNKIKTTNIANVYLFICRHCSLLVIWTFHIFWYSCWQRRRVDSGILRHILLVSSTNGARQHSNTNIRGRASSWHIARLPIFVGKEGGEEEVLLPRFMRRWCH